MHAIRLGFSLLFLTFFLCPNTVFTQPQDLSNSRLLHEIQSLPTCGSVLYLAAHPDDENTRLISYLVNDKHYRTAYLSLTRGDGGQNLIGDEQGTALGLIRTHELLQARKVDGAQQYFTRAYDFGYSKSPEETLTIWNEKEVLEDIVRVIREFQPDVIICRFPTTGEGGHGHHTASALLAEKAFKAAADPTQFTEQLYTLKPWQAERLLWNTFNFGNRNTTAADQLQIEVGGYNSLLGKSYGEIAAESRSCHSSQAFGTARNRGNITEFFKTIAGSAPKSSLMDGINTSWNRFDHSGEIQVLMNRLNAYLEVWIQSPITRIPELITLYQSIQSNASIPAVWKNHALTKIKTILLGMHGWYAECSSTQGFVSPGDSLHFTFSAVQRMQFSTIRLRTLSLNSYTETIDSLLAPSKILTRKISIPILSAPPEQPYWLQQPIKNKGMFQVKSDDNQTLPRAAPQLRMQVNLEISSSDSSEGDARISIPMEIPVLHKTLDPSKGEVYQPLFIAPPATLNFTEPSYVFTSTHAKGKSISLKVRSFQKNVNGIIRLELPPGWSSEPTQQTVQLALEQEEQLVSFKIIPPSGKRANQQSLIKASIEIQGQQYQHSFQSIQYPHIPNQVLFHPSEAVLMEVELQSKIRKVGYISGAGDKVAQSLRECGILVEEIEDAHFLNNRLLEFDAILTGVRAWNTLPQLKNWREPLLAYVQSGGVLLVQYNTSNNLLIPNIGPYPFKISRERVTDENAEVSFTTANEVTLNYPNSISPSDFTGWVQERGLYFGETEDAQYRMPLSMADPGEKKQSGSLLIADYGKGRFIYTGIAFFRQLPAGVPGAYRLLINLIHPPK